MFLNSENIKEELKKQYPNTTFSGEEIEVLIEGDYEIDDIAFFNKDKKLAMLQAKLNIITYELSKGSVIV